MGPAEMDKESKLFFFFLFLDKHEDKPSANEPMMRRKLPVNFEPLQDIYFEEIQINRVERYV